MPMLQDAQEVTADSSSGVGNALENSIEGFWGAFPLDVVAIGALKMIAILVLAWLFIKFLDRALRMWTSRFSELPETNHRRQRALTISTLLSSTARYMIWGLALIMVLGELQIDVGALIATAGIAGIAIGFGAQSLVKDMIGGVLLLFDDTIHVGDIIRVGTDTGWVEDIGLRMIKVRRLNGELLMIPAGDLRTFGNNSIGFARAVVEVGLTYGQDVDRAMEVMQEVADEWAKSNKGLLQDEDPVVQAITAFGDSSVNARILIKMDPGKQWEMERQIRRMLKIAFDREGIVIPFPQRSLHIESGSLK